MVLENRTVMFFIYVLGGNEMVLSFKAYYFWGYWVVLRISMELIRSGLS